MTAIQSTILWIDDRLNPIVVKELRQAVMSRFIVTTLMLFLIAQLLTLGVVLLASDTASQNFSAGRDVFVVLHGILLTAGILLVPLYVGTRLAAERSDTNVDLLFVTTLKPRTIVAGKLLFGLIITLLIYSATAPFMVLTYLLRGIDLPSIFILLGFDLVVIVSAIQLAIFFATLPTTRSVKMLLGLVCVGLLFFILMGTIGAGMGMLYSGVGSRLDTWDFWGRAIGVVVLIGIAVGILFSFTVTMVTPPSANRAIIPRLVLTGSWIVTYFVAWLLYVTLHVDEFFTIWFGFSVIIFSAAFLVCVSERDKIGPRLRRSIPRNRLLRPFALLFNSGAMGGLLWSASIVLITFFVIQQSEQWFSITIPSDMFGSRAIICSYLFCYAMSGLLLRRLVIKDGRTTSGGVLGLLLAAGGSLLPLLIMFFVDARQWNHDNRWLLLNPFGITGKWNNTDYRFDAILIVSIWGAAMILLHLPWFYRQLRDFRPPSSLKQ